MSWVTLTKPLASGLVLSGILAAMSLLGASSSQPPGNGTSQLSTPAQAQPTFIESDVAELAVTLEPSSSGLEGKTTVFLKSAESVDAFKFRALLKDLKGENRSSDVEITTPESSKGIIKGETKAFELKFEVAKETPAFSSFQKNSSEVLGGYLVVGEAGMYQTKVIKISASVHSPYSTFTVWPAVITALLLVVGSYLLSGKPRAGRADRLGLPQWDAGSLATNFSLITAIAATVLTNSVFPTATHHLPKPEYSALALLFGVFFPLIAPAIYKAILIPVSAAEAPAGDDKQTKFEGYVGLFLVSSFLTLWGITGLAPVVALLLDELRVAGTLPWTTVIVFQGVTGIVWVFLLLHTVRTITRTLKTAKPAPTPPKQGEPAANVESASTPAQTWQWP